MARGDYEQITSALQKVPDKLFLEMLKVHKENLEKVEEEFQNEIPELQNEFIDKIKNFVQKNELPIDEQILEARQKESIVQLKDPLVYPLEEWWGEYDLENGTIRLNSGLNKEDRRLSFMHEKFHELSGRTVIRDELLPPHRHLRGGLRFNTPIRRFGWLDEAITESLTMRLMNLKESKKELRPYFKERKLWDMLMNKGKIQLPESLFINAYFENYEPAVDRASIPNWKELSKKISEAYDPTFLVRLDRLIQAKGIDYAIDALKQDPLQI